MKVLHTNYPKKNVNFVFSFTFMRLRLLIVISLFAFSTVARASEPQLIDSIMNQVMMAAETYNGVTKSYEASVYMRTLVNTKKKNFLYKYTYMIPNFVLHDQKNDEAIIESVSKLKFKAPNNYLQDINYVTGTLSKKSDIALLPYRFISMDVYDESAHGEIFYLPLRRKSSRYYVYSLAYVENLGNRKIYSINFTPKYKNPQLISGSFMVEDNTWRVLGFYGEGNDLFVDFTFDIKMGDKLSNQFLPVKFNIVQVYSYLGNKVYNTYQADLDYKDIEFTTIESKVRNYNLGNTYRMRLDSVPLKNDSVLWENLRTFPLNAREEELIAQHNDAERKALEEKLQSNASTASNDMALRLMKNVVVDTRYRFKSGDFRFSGLLNPSMIGYSTQDGFSYGQKMALAINLPRQQRINVNWFRGYLFGKKQLRFGIHSVWNYEPTKLGYLSFSAGRGNPSYSSRFLDLVKDSLQNFNDLNLGYYKDYYFKLFNSIELLNGLQLGVGVDYHIREPNRKNGVVPLYIGSGDILTTQYNFVPLVSVSWTPEQYYVMDRNQKVYVRSDYPTFKIEFAQSLNGVLGNKSSYNRVEFDVNQRIRFGLMKSLNYHAGFGFFRNQKNDYFNDFSYFAKSYLPETWGDGIGGGFSVLPYRYFNSSDQYAQAHLMYETSKFMFTRLSALSSGVARKRIYLSQLYTPFMKSYTEIGYGIGNRFLNAAVFVGFHKLTYENITAKVVFLL